MLLTLLLPGLLVLSDSILPFCELLPFVIFLFATFGFTFSSSFESIPMESSFSCSSPKSHNSRLSSLSNTDIFRRLWLVDFAFPGFGGLATLRGVRRGLGLGSSKSLSSIVFFCRFFAAGVRPFWVRFVLPEEKKLFSHNAFYSCCWRCCFSLFVVKLRDNRHSTTTYQPWWTGRKRHRHRWGNFCIQQFISTYWLAPLARYGYSRQPVH